MAAAKEPSRQIGENGAPTYATAEEVEVSGRSMVIIRKGNQVTLQPLPGSTQSRSAPVVGAQPQPRARLRGVVLTLLLPWRTAKCLLKPAVGSDRKTLLDRLTFWRAVVGLAVIAAATFPYPKYWHGIPYETYLKSGYTAQYALYSAPALFLVLLVLTRPGCRVALLRGVLSQLRYGVLALVVFYLPVVWLTGGKLPHEGVNTIDPLWVPDTIEFNFADPWAAVLFVFVAIPLVIYLFCWVVCLWFCTLYWAARTGFWISETHPLLAPIVTTAVMLLLTCREILDPPTGDVPALVWLTLTLCGAVSSVVLSVFEYRHLRSTGHRFRNGPKPLAPAGA